MQPPRNILQILLTTSVLFLTAGCEMVWVVPPADGRVVDAGSGRPVVAAHVTRVCADAPANTKTDALGYFSLHGKRRLQLAIGDPLTAPASYRIEAPGYLPLATNAVSFGWANQSGLRHHLKEIPISPK